MSLPLLVFFFLNGASNAPDKEFIYSLTLTTLRNNLTGGVGHKFTVGNTPITVYALARWVVSGNSGSHTVKLVQSTGGTAGIDVPGGSVVINTSGAPAGAYKWGNLASPVILHPNTTYFIFQSETSGGDQWFEYTTAIQTMEGATKNTAAYYLDSSPTVFTSAGSPGDAYGAPNFRYKVDFVTLESPAYGATTTDTTPTLEFMGTEYGNAQYYFDASDAAATDPNNVWTNDANAFDGNLSTFAYANVAGSTASNFLMGQGTNAPASGGTIVSVRARYYYTTQTPGGSFTGVANIFTDGLAESLGTVTSSQTSGGTETWSAYTNLSVPSGGWTWAKLAALETKIYLSSVNTVTLEIRKVELDVTFAQDVRYNLQLDSGNGFNSVGTPTTTAYYIDTSDGGPTDPNAVWTNDANAFDGNVATHASSTTNGSSASNFLKGDGTNAPSLASTITQVRAKIHASISAANASAEIYTDNLGELLGTAIVEAGSGSYVTLTAPTGGWTWTQVQALETKIYRTSGMSEAQVQKVEIEVTSSTYAPILDKDSGGGTTSTETFTSTSTWTCPPYVTSVTAKVRGAGGSGGGTDVTNGGAGGGGGAYSEAVISVVPGTVYTVTVGAGGAATTGAGSAGGDSWFGSATTVMAKGGSGGAAGVGTNTPGGQASAGVGTTKFSGGNAGTGNTSATGGGGGGSGDAANGGNGGNASINTGGTAGAGGNAGGGSGGAGTLGAGNAGTSPGGGGSGGYSANSGAGARGEVSVTYTSSDPDFTNTVNGADTSPFASGQKIAYTPPTALANGTYWWRVRILAPLGANTWSGWSETRRLTIGTSATSYTLTHSTNSLLRKANTLTHTISSNKRRAYTVTHTTSANKKVAGFTHAHTADALKRKATIVSHATSANRRKATVVSHTTDANKKVTGFTRSHTTDSLLRKQLTRSHTTDSNKKKATTVSHTTSANKRAALTRSHTADANKKVSGFTRTHTTDSLKRRAYTVFHTTDSQLFKRVFEDLIDNFNDNSRDTTKWSGTNAYDETGGRAEFFASGNGTFSQLLSLDLWSLIGSSIYFQYGPVGISTNASIIIGLYDASNNHLTRIEHLQNGQVNIFDNTFTPQDSFTYSASTAWVRFRESAGTLYVDTASHPSSGWTNQWSATAPSGLSSVRFKATGGTFGNASDSATGWVDNVNASGAQFAKTHTTDAVKRKQFTLVHTTDSNKRRAYTVSHTTDSNKKLTGNVVVHTTDSNKKRAYTVSHTTSANNRRAYTVAHTTSANKRAVLTRTHTTDALLRKQFTRTHTTNALKRIQSVLAHTTNSLVRKAFTLIHTTSANKRRAAIVLHTTDANKKRSHTVLHTTSANKKLPNNVVTHTTSANKRRTGIALIHTTDSFLRRQVVRSHTTDSLKRAFNTRTHTTDSLLRKANVLTHLTDVNKRRATVVSHTTDSNKRRAYTVAHSTDSNRKKAYAVSHTTSANKRKELTASHTTDATKRRALIQIHSTDTLLRERYPKNKIFNGSFESGSGTTNANFDVPGWILTSPSSGTIVSVTNDASDGTQAIQIAVDSANSNNGIKTSQNAIKVAANSRHRLTLMAKSSVAGQLQIQLRDNFNFGNFLQSDGVTWNSTPSYFSINTTTSYTLFTVDVTTSSTGLISISDLKRSGAGGNHANKIFYIDDVQLNAITWHTTDALLRRQLTASHTTSSNKKKANNAVFHFADAIVRGENQQHHNTDSNKRRVTQVSHTTDSNKRRANNLVSHLTDTLKRTRFSLSHLTDSNKKKLTTVNHTTDSLLRAQKTLTHLTNALKRTLNVLSHNTSSMLRKANVVQHATDANKRRTQTVSHSTDSNKRKTFSVVHATDSTKIRIHSVAHTTDANKKRSGNLRTHTTDALLRATKTVSHTTSSLKKTLNTLVHTTSSLIRKARVVSHTADSNKRRSRIVFHFADAFKRADGEEYHNTDALLKQRYSVPHSTDSFLRRQTAISHTTSANKRRAQTVSHSTSAVLGDVVGIVHTTDASLFSRRGNKKILVNGQWTYGIVRVLDNGVWVVAEVKYFDGSEWLLTTQ